MNELLAAISGQALINVVIWLIIAAVIFWLITWALNSIPIQEPFKTIIRVIMILAVVLICINALLGLTGHPLIAWP